MSRVLLGMSGTSGFRFGEFEVDAAEGVLRRRGYRVRLQDLPLRLLVALAERPGELVSREELRKVLWPTEAYGDFAHRLGGALNRLREALGDSAEHPRVIETVPRRGYRFCARVSRIAAAAPADPLFEPDPPPAAATGGRRLRVASAVVLALAVSAAAGRVPTSVEGEEPTGIAVLPFMDLSGEDAALCDGLTEDAITILARGGASVIGRTSVMAYRASGKRVDEIGRELGVTYVVEGSVRRGPSAVRVTVRLLDARTQAPLWAESLDGPPADPLPLQSRVARAVGDAVRAHLLVP